MGGINLLPFAVCLLTKFEIYLINSASYEIAKTP